MTQNKPSFANSDFGRAGKVAHGSFGEADPAPSPAGLDMFLPDSAKRERESDRRMFSGGLGHHRKKTERWAGRWIARFLHHSPFS